MRTLNRQRQWQGHEHSSSKSTTVASFLPKIPGGENSPTESQREFSRVGLAKGAIPLWTRSSGRVDLQGNHLQLCIQICIRYIHYFTNGSTEMETRSPRKLPVQQTVDFKGIYKGVFIRNCFENSYHFKMCPCHRSTASISNLMFVQIPNSMFLCLYRKLLLGWKHPGFCELGDVDAAQCWIGETELHSMKKLHLPLRAACEH